MQPYSGLRTECQVRCAQIRYLLYACSGVIKEAKQGLVAQSLRVVGGQGSEQSINLVAFEIQSLARLPAFDGNGGNLLCFPEHAGLTAGKILEKGMQRRQALVSGSNPITTFLFKVLQKMAHSLASEISQFQAGDPAMLILCSELQEQAQALLITSDAGRAQPPLAFKVIF
ncbi:hypothetical protein MSNKSG1_03525 [Marinobacter santoriniensis NKSG1]|uniref:Uncharacterized protein n=1 Tax=Marinobacter santoriniensis NKSG1 TaxID=1288826 RepID=M7CX84_9GAMM|nr:hypothetical protein MSNKSG1_03525 [Marinobacter santoriniensis NKSG1]